MNSNSPINKQYFQDMGNDIQRDYNALQDAAPKLNTEPNYQNLYGASQNLIGLQANQIPATVVNQTVTNPVTFNGIPASMIPVLNNTYDLGASDLSWKNTYAYNYYYHSGAKLSYFDVIVGFDSSCDYVCTGTNDEVTILAAINYGITNGRRTIRFRSGTYVFDATLTIPKDACVTLLGDFLENGSGSTLYGGVYFKCNANTTNMIEFKGNSVPTAYSDLTKGLSIVNIAVDGNNKATNTLYLLNSDRVILTDSRIINGKAKSLYADYDGADPIGSTSYQPGGIFATRCRFNCQGSAGGADDSSVYLKFQTQCWFTSCWYATSSAADFQITLDRCDNIFHSNVQFNSAGTAIVNALDSATKACFLNEFSGGDTLPGNGVYFVQDNFANASSTRNLTTGGGAGNPSLATPINHLGVVTTGWKVGPMAGPIYNTSDQNKLLKLSSNRQELTAFSNMTIDDNGKLLNQMVADSTTAFQWLDSSGNIVLKLDSTNRINTGLKWRAGDGTASAPTYSFTNATDTGFYRNATHQMTAASNGAAAMVFDGSSNIQIVNKLANYNGDTTAGNGAVVVVANVALLAQTTSLGPTTLFTPAASGVYRVSVYTVDSAAGAAGTLSVVIGWTDDVQAQTTSPAANIGLTILGAESQGTAYIRSTATAITYTATLTGVIGNPTYGLFITVERLS